MRQRGLIPISFMVYAAVAVAFIGLLTYGYFSITKTHYERGRAEVKAEWEEANRKQKEADEQRIAAAGDRHEKATAKSRVVYKTLTKTVDRLVMADSSYGRDCFDPLGMQLANAALAGALPITAEPDQPYAGPDTVGRSLRGIRPPEANRGLGVVLRVQP